MGQVIDMLLPRMGETMDEGRIGQMFKRPGEAFRRGETLLEVESDKTTVEVPALMDGVLVAWLVASDEMVPVETAIARIQVEGVVAAPAAAQLERPAAPVIRQHAAPVARPESSASRPRASTAARAEARRRGIDLGIVRGTGRGWRIQRADLAPKPARQTGHVTTAQGDIFLRSWTAQGASRGTALLLHGLFSDSQSFATLGRMLAARGLDVMAPDLPGHGETRCAAATIAEITTAIAALLPQGRLHLAGHSLGALIATELAARAASLTLLAPAGCGETINGDFVTAMLAGHTDHALALMGAGELPPAPRAALATLMSSNQAQLSAIAGDVAEDGAQTRSILAKLAALTIPVTAVFERDDPVIPAVQALNLPPNVAVRFLPGTGHLPHWQAPEQVAAWISAAF